MLPDEYEPKILAFFCNYCSYAGADLAGTARMSYPPNIMIIRVLCTGRVDPVHIIEAFKNGADGVLVAGCHYGDCHFISGNYKTGRKVALLRRTLEQFGIEPERLRFKTISSGEAERFVEAVKEMTEDLKKLGPSPLGLGHS
ncbi:MAG: hydrogenase iron-sulfur subunit [Candidatus Bathyarchaeia archaeon]